MEVALPKKRLQTDEYVCRDQQNPALSKAGIECFAAFPDRDGHLRRPGLEQPGGVLNLSRRQDKRRDPGISHPNERQTKACSQIGGDPKVLVGGGCLAEPRIVT